jgi:two-component system sensor histidine kinase KdpD
MLASQTALALEGCRLAEEAHAARTQVATERSRSALLSSVSHDVRTPLAAITGAATSLRDGSAQLEESTRRELAEMIAEEAQRLNRLIGNILDMTRLESGNLRVRKEWHSLEEVVGAALVRLEGSLDVRPVLLLLSPDLPLVSLDDVLFEQVVRNLIENAHKYSPPELPIEVRAAIDGEFLRLEVADRGPGLPPGEEARIFEGFYRGANTAGIHGAGLGLAICQGIVLGHAGTLTAANRPGGGAIFTVCLPLGGEPPRVEDEPTESMAASVR